MSGTGMKAALTLGEKLPVYPSLEVARTELFAQRDRLLSALTTAAAGEGVALDHSPESLKTVEPWFFRVVEAGRLPIAGMDLQTLDLAIAMYFGEVVVRTTDFEWTVAEFAFAQGRYEIGVARPLYTRMLGGGLGLVERTRNTRRQSIWREYASLPR